MALDSGRKLGPYEIESAAGAGGMGEVYKARDTRLERTVAIKILPESMAGNPDLRARFDREARAISSLNHPHICTLYDVGHENGTDYLVMEYLEGESLDQRLFNGPLEAKELLEYAIQIADALDKAHRQGLVHRDLKPGNVIITKSGAKLLDFGLVKLSMESGLGGNIHNITQTTPLTGIGTILGTVSYMAPEQLEGQEADNRSDIFSFGAMLYEMATGQKPFEGKSQATMIAAIMERDPRPISEIKPMLPPAINRLVKKCLAKDPDDRWQSAKDLCDELKWIQQSGSRAGIPARVASRRKKRFRLGWTIAGVMTLASIILGAMLVIQPEQEINVRRFRIGDFEHLNNVNWPRISPDGRLLAFRATDSLGNSSIWIRPMNSLNSYPLAGTENAGRPFWSPDSRYLAYFINNQLRKVPASGGPVQLICETDGYDGCWGSSGIILFDNSVGDSIRQVPASGGVATAATVIDRERGENMHAWPAFLPDGKHFLYLAQVDTTSAALGDDVVCVGSLDGGFRKELFRVSSRIEYSPAGFILHERQGVLLAHPFDANKLEITGEPIPVAENVGQYFNASLFSVSNEGTLVYQTGSDMGMSQLVWFNRGGQPLDTVGNPAPYRDIALSPDESRLAYQLFDIQKMSDDIWVYDLVRDVPTRLTFEESREIWPVWSPDGMKIIYAELNDGYYRLMERQANGLGEARLLLEAEEGSVGASDWSRDGKTISIFHFLGDGDIWLMNDPDSGKHRVFTDTPHSEARSRISPNGRYIAYQSDESGRSEIYVRELSGQGGKWQVSADGGFQPLWRTDGRELYYSNENWDIMAVSVATDGETFQADIPMKLFNQRYNTAGLRQTRFVASADGQKFLMNVALNKENNAEMAMVLNWDAELKKK
ncbi:MAG: protein kinase [candidate division Zixibacteria bacterium]|nr:protein kinase [candidate division Zixibacteria bacterium]NIW40028.1 protein kinase [candidate division Zixibacteria bacterium]NIX58195.1 protein kinase [candidate division Zixibacteria bacterium]